MSGFEWEFDEPDLPEIPGLEVQELLGAGSMGRVYRARERTTGRAVAVKLLPAEDLSERGLARLRREGQLMGRLDDRAIAQVHDFGQVPAGAYLVCELIVDHRPLDVAARHLEPGQRRALLEEVIRAVGVAHEAGITHRDLKPGNVLVDVSGQPKVIDFGLATAQGVDRLTRSHEFVGTYLYAAPERLQADWAPSPRADVWSLGALAHELLGGQPPYPVETFADLVKRRAPPPLAAGVAPPLARVIQRALAPDPEDRYADGQSLHRAWRSACTSEPPRPRAFLVLAVLVALAALVFALAVASWLNRARAPGAGSPAASRSPAVSPAPLPSAGLLTSPSLSGLPPANDGAELLALLAAGDLATLATSSVVSQPPLAQRARGLARLLLDDREGARLDLGPQDPLLELERRRRELAGLIAERERRLGEDPDVRLSSDLVGAVAAVTSASEAAFAVGELDAVSLAWAQRAQGTVAAAALVSRLEEAKSLQPRLGFMVGLRRQGAQAIGVRVARRWLRYLQARLARRDPKHRRSGVLRSEPWGEVVGITRRQPGFGPWRRRIDPRLDSVWLGLRLLGRALSPDTEGLGRTRTPLVQALESGRWPPGAEGLAFRRRVQRTLIQELLHQGQARRVEGKLRRARQNLALACQQLDQLLEQEPQAFDRQLAVTVALVSGQRARAARRLADVPPGEIRRLLQAELQLQEGKVRAALRQAQALARESKGPLRAAALRLALHARLLLQPARRDELLVARQGRAEYGPLTQRQPYWLPWRSRTGLEQAVAGEWWQEVAVPESQADQPR